MAIETKKQARELLGVNENASEQEIKKAARDKYKLVYSVNKVKGGDTEKMGDIDTARDLLLGKIEEVKTICQNLDEMGIKGSGLFHVIFSDRESTTKMPLMKQIIDECGESPNKYTGFINPIHSNQNIKIHGLSYFEIAEIAGINLPYDIKDFLKSYGATEDHTIGYHFYKKALLKEMNIELKVTQTNYGWCLDLYKNSIQYEYQKDAYCGYYKYKGDVYSWGKTHLFDQKIISNIFPSSVEVTARMDGNIDFEVIHTGASIVIKGNKLTAESLLKAVSKSNTVAPKGFNGLDYLMANQDLFDHLVDPAKHYVEAGASEHRIPSNFFSEHKYIELNPDIKEGVDRGWLKSGFFHFANNGCKEGRSPDGVYNENSYVSSNGDLAHHKNTGSMECAYFHCIDHGMFEGRIDCVDLYAAS